MDMIDTTAVHIAYKCLVDNCADCETMVASK